MDNDAPSADMPTTNTDELALLRERAELAEGDRDKYLGLLKRSTAEYDNYRKRLQRELADERRYANADFARQLLPVIDHLRHALDSAPTTDDVASLTEGVNMVYSQLLDALRRFDIHPIEALGEAFDPTRHEAVMQDLRPDVAPGTVTQVLQPGFRIHERILRPARVAVSSAPNEKSVAVGQ